MPTYQRFATETRIQLIQTDSESGPTLVVAPNTTEYHKALFLHCTDGASPITMRRFHQEVEGMFWAHGVTLIEIKTTKPTEKEG